MSRRLFCVGRLADGEWELMWRPGAREPFRLVDQPETCYRCGAWLEPHQVDACAVCRGQRMAEEYPREEEQ